MIFQNSAGRVDLFKNIVHVKITDGSCPREDFEEIMDSLIELYEGTAEPLALIFNVLEDDVSGDHIEEIANFVRETDISSHNIIGTAIVMAGVQADVAQMVLKMCNVKRPIKICKSEEAAATYIAELCG